MFMWDKMNEMNPHNQTEIKAWHQTLNTDQREKFRKNFIDSLMIINFSTWFMFQKYLTLFDTAETQAYNESETRAEYYCTVAQETYKIYDSIREENSGLTIDQLNLNEGQPISNNTDLEIIEKCIKSNLLIDEDCPDNCEHLKCSTKRNILRHLLCCNLNNCSTPFCNASKLFLKHYKHN